MKNIKKLVAITTAVAMMGGSSVMAQDEAGAGYYDSFGSTTDGAILAVGVIVGAIVIAAFVNNGNGGSGHVHSIPE
jgi:hypothetical protein